MISDNFASRPSKTQTSIRKALSILFKPDNVVELRSFQGKKKTISGYFNDHDLLSKEASELSSNGCQVYVTLNQVNPDLLARAANRIEAFPASTTSDKDIAQIRWLPLDFDPVRPSGVSSTDEEKEAAKLCTSEVRKYLQAKGWPDPVMGDSGNGWHLLYAVDLPATQESQNLIKGTLEALAFQFDNDKVKVDTSVHNPARIWKLYGTVARKGDPVPDRPHRLSRIKKVSSMTEVVDVKLLEDVAGMKPSAPKYGSGRGDNIGHGKFDLAGWIESHEISVLGDGEWNGKGYRWILEECPWNGHTDRAAFIVRWPNGTIGAGCHHNSCEQYGWRDLREHYEPGCYSPEVSLSDDSSIPQALPFPTEVLPIHLRTFVEEAAASIGCPPEFVGVPMLATLGAAIGNSRVLEVKTHYTESAALYTAIIGDPGSSKSPALNAATVPALRKQEELGREYNEAFAEYNRERNQAGAEGLDPPVEPFYRRTMVQNTTVEALTERLRENPRGLLSNNDELSGWLRGMDQYKSGKGSDRQFWLSTWSNSPVFVDRKGRKDPLMISRSFVGIAGGIQPGILSEVRNEREDGLMDRFLFAYPAPRPTRWSDSEISEETMAAYQGIYEELYGLGMDTDENGVSSPRRATFMPQAKQAFVEAHDSLCEEIEQPDFPQHLKGPWSKMRAYLARISLIICLARTAQLRDAKIGAFYEIMKEEATIQVRDVEAAIALVEYFKAHARKVYGKLHNNQGKNTTNSKPSGNAGDDKGNDLLAYLVQFLKNSDGYWEGKTSRLYEICKADCVPGLPGGNGAFGKQLRKVINDQDNDLVLDEGWRGKNQIVKLSLSTLDTVDNVGATYTEGTNGTKGKNQGDQLP